MTAFSLAAGTIRRERVSFVPTTFFAEFLAGTHKGLEIEARYHALSRKSSADLAKLGISRDEISQVTLKSTHPLGKH